MPIDYKRYPKNWKTEIRPAALLRAFYRCEECGAIEGQPHPKTGRRVVLAIAHLDHDVKNNAPDNLRALCHRCHFRYDDKLHRMNCNKTRIKNLSEKTTKDFRGETKSYRNVGKKLHDQSRGDTRQLTVSTSKKSVPRVVYTHVNDTNFDENDETRDDEFAGEVRRKRVSPRTKHVEPRSTHLGTFRKLLEHAPIELGVERQPCEGRYNFIPTWHFFKRDDKNGLIIADMDEQEFNNFMTIHADRFRVEHQKDGGKRLFRR